MQQLDALPVEVESVAVQSARFGDSHAGSCQHLDECSVYAVKVVEDAAHFGSLEVAFSPRRAGSGG